MLSAVRPRQHVGLWRRGPELWRNLVHYFEDRPRLTAVLSAASVLGGLWLAFQAQDEG